MLGHRAWTLGRGPRAGGIVLQSPRIAAPVNRSDLCWAIGLLPVATLLFDGSKVVALNEKCRQLLSMDKTIADCAENAAEANDALRELPLDVLWSGALEEGESFAEGRLWRDGTQELWLECRCRSVSSEGITLALIHLFDVTAKKSTERKLRRFSRLRELMLEVTQTVLEVEDFKKLCQVILTKALQAIPRAAIGSVLLKEGEYFVFGAGAGFTDDLRSFKVPIKESFLYRATRGKMDRVVNVPDLRLIDTFYFVNTEDKGGRCICSTVIAPIYVQGELIGCVSVDSVELAAFDDDDLQSMIFIRDNIEIAVTNHFLYQEKAYLARHDQLTGLNNRWYFDGQAVALLERARRYKESFHIVLFDVDRLKYVNDAYGHLVGDQVLRKIAAALFAETRKSDVLARLGGDEFIGIFFNASAEALCEKFRQSLVALLTDPLLEGGSVVPCTYSYGVASFPDDGETIETLIAVADSRMFSDKGRSS